MNIFAGILSNFCRSSNRTNDLSSHIFFKIVDSIGEDEQFVLQCINTKAIIHANITDIVLDVDILYKLHPVQACYIGIEYSKYLKKADDSPDMQNEQKETLDKYSVHRYGCYRLCYQDRKGDLCFSDQKTNEEHLMDPRDIALSEELISEFDAAQAFYIGMMAGFKLNNPIHNHSSKKTTAKPQLSLIKN